MAVCNNKGATAIVLLALTAAWTGCVQLAVRSNLENEGYEFLSDRVEAARRYDVITDTTTLVLVGRKDVTGLRTVVVTNWKGRTPPAEGLTHLVFVGSNSSLAQGNTFFALDRGDCLEGIVAADDRRFGPWPAVHRDTGRFRTRDTDVMPSGRRILGYGPAEMFQEYFAFEVSDADLRQIAHAEIVLGRICTVEFEWDEGFLSDLDFYLNSARPS